MIPVNLNPIAQQKRMMIDNQPLKGVPSAANFIPDFKLVCIVSALISEMRVGIWIEVTGRLRMSLINRHLILMIQPEIILIRPRAPEKFWHAMIPAGRVRIGCRAEPKRQTARYRHNS